MRIALVGPSTAGKSTLARQIAEYVGTDNACFVDVDDFVAEKWKLPAPGLRRLWLMEQWQFDEHERGLSPDQLVDERESQFQDALDGLSPDKITVIAMSTYAFKYNAANYPQEARKQWWDRFVQDAANPASQTYVLRLVMKAEDIYTRLRSRFEAQVRDYPDMAGSFARWAEKTVWREGMLIPRKQAIKDLRHNQIFELVPHYWQFPYLTIDSADQYISPQEVLEALGLPASQSKLVAMLTGAPQRCEPKADQTAKKV